jgi:hypothetical protein
MVSIIRQLFILSLVMCSTIGLILCFYVADSLFRIANNGTLFAVQLMPEAKILTNSEANDF